MTPPFLPFDGLQPGTHALTDASSLRALADRAATLTTQLNSRMARTILNDLDGFDLQPALSLLERWIAVDQLVVDVIAADSLNASGGAVRSFRYEPSELDRLTLSAPDLSRRRMEAFLTHVSHGLLTSQTGKDLWGAAESLSLSLTLIPQNVFERCMEVLGRTSNAIKAAAPEVRWASFGFGPEKEYGEILEKFYGTAACLARSNVGVERTLVYYETAAAAGVPIILHPSRYNEAKAIEAACCDAYSAVKGLLRKALDDPIRSQLETLGQPAAVAAPPLILKIIETAGGEGLSIIQAATQIKDSKNARAFRRWLTDLQLCLAQGTTGGKIEALRMLDELRRVASLWAAHLDSTVGVTHKRRELRLSWVPRIGGLLELLDKPTLRDPILNRQGYLAFVSSWYAKV